MTTRREDSDSTLSLLCDVSNDHKSNDEEEGRCGSTSPSTANKGPVCFGRVADLEAMVPSQWWKTVFADGMYLKTDGDVVEDPDITSEEIKMLEDDATLRNIFADSQGMRRQRQWTFECCYCSLFYVD